MMRSEIRLSTKTLVKRSLIRETLRHELMHAALSIAGVSYAEHPDEEAFVRCMDTLFFPMWSRLSEKLNEKE
jgi:predicted SprT family Zn-dependent metalloprotease